jgi:hypothetical protein
MLSGHREVIVIMKHLTLIVLATGIVLSGSAFAKSKSGDARKFVTERVKQSVQADSAAKPAKGMIAAAITPTDLNRDGITDFIVDYSKLTSSAWCGTSGCRYQLWLGAADKTAKIVFDRQMRAVTMRQGAYGTIYDFAFNGTICDKSDGQICTISFAYDTPSGVMTAVPIPGKKKVKRRADPIDPMFFGK